MEQLIIEILYVILRTLFQSFATIGVFVYMLTPKFNRAIIIAAMSVPYILLEYIIPKSETELRMIVMIMIFMIPALTCFKDKKHVCVFAFALLIATTMLIDIIASMIGFKIFGAHLLAGSELTHDWNTIAYTLMIDAIFTIGGTFFVLLWNRFYRNAHARSVWLFMLFPVSQYVFFCACSYQTWSVTGISLIDNPFIIAAILLSLLADIAMLRALTQNSRMQQLKQRLADMQHEMDMQLQYYDGLADKMQEVREYRHDINNLISVTEALLLGSYTDDGHILFEELKEKAASSAMPVYSADPTVNAVLYHKAQAARDKGVSFSVSMARDECFPFERSDICSLLANLLDNALREAEKFSDSFVEVSVSKSMGLLRLNVTNSTDKSIGSERPSSDKPDGEKHGFGLEIVERVADKYNGKFVLTADNGTARAAVVLPLENACR